MTFTFAPLLSKKEIVDFIESISPTTVDETLGDWLLDSYELQKVPINTISSKTYNLPEGVGVHRNNKTIRRYAAMNTEQPPLVINPLDVNTHWIVDGFHRFSSSKIKKNTHVMAYVGKKQ